MCHMSRVTCHMSHNMCKIKTYIGKRTKPHSRNTTTTSLIRQIHTNILLYPIELNYKKIYSQNEKKEKKHLKHSSFIIVTYQCVCFVLYYPNCTSEHLGNPAMARPALVGPSPTRAGSGLSTGPYRPKCDPPPTPLLFDLQCVFVQEVVLNGQ